MKLTVLLVQYNKVTDEAFSKFARYSSARIKTVDLKDFGKRLDTQSNVSISKLLSKALPFDAVMIGDIFWPSGQNVCRWCEKSGVPCYFLQHGQWIYVRNKKNPKFLPAVTFVFGQYLERECSSWPYGKRSHVIAMGTPRYDDAVVSPRGAGIYFSPPVIHERIPSSADQYSKSACRQVESLSLANPSGLMIHPHYREGEISKLREWFPAAQFIHPMDNPLKWIQKCSMVLTHRNSTTVLDAIACGKKTVLANFNRFPSHYKEGHFGRFAVETHSPEECLCVLRDTEPIDLEGYEDDAAEYIMLGNASERIDQIIHDRSV